MKAHLCALALVPFVSLAAVAQAAPPAPLSDSQMDTVTAGWTLLETDVSNTSWTRIGVWTPITGTCGSCYLSISSQAFNIRSNFGPVPGSAPST